MSTPVATALRLTTIDVLKSIPNFGERVFDSRTTQLAEDDVPCLVVFNPSSSTRPLSWQPVAGEREQSLKIFAEFDIGGATPELADAALGALADEIEYAIWNALHRSAAWCALWKSPPTWQAAIGRDAASNRRRCTLEVTLLGTMHQDVGDREDLVRLTEIRADFTESDGTQPGYDGPVYQGRVPVNPEEA